MKHFEEMKTSHAVQLLKQTLTDCQGSIEPKQKQVEGLRIKGLDDSSTIDPKTMEKCFLIFAEKVVQCFPIYLHAKKPELRQVSQTEMDKDWKAPEPEQPFEKFHFQQEDSIDSEDEPVPDDPFVNGVYKLMELMTYTMITHFEDSVKSVTYEEIMDLLNKNQKLIPSDIFMRLKQYAEKKQQDMI